MSSEIFALRLRARASALGQVGGRVSSGLVSMSFLSASRVISVAGVFFVFASISAISILFVKVCIPETKGKTLEKIEMMFRGDKDSNRGEVEFGDAERLIPIEGK